MGDGTAVINAIGLYRKAADQEGVNAANKEVIAFDPVNSLFIEGSGQIQAASPRVYNQHARDVNGEMQATGKKGDIAIDKGQGYFVVKTKTNAIALSKVGSFRIREVDQKIVGPSGEVLMGWVLDAKGEIPGNNSSMSSLEELTTKQLTARAVATDQVSMSANLKASQKAMDGPGSVMSIQVHSIVNATDLIAPGETTTGSIFIGDQIKLTPGGAGAVQSIFEYGGLSLSVKPSTGVGQSLYSATAAAGAFTVLAKDSIATSNDHIVADTGFSIRLGAAGEKFNFVATTASNEAADGRFNSLTSLSQAINSITEGKVRARVVDGRLLIAAKDADDALVFENIKPPVGAGLLGAVENLGLIDVAQKGVNDAARYASLDELKTKLNAVTGLRGEVIDQTKMRFGSDDARKTLAVSGESYRPRNFRRAYASSSLNDSARRFGVNIESPSHGLKTGDHVHLDGQLIVNAGAGVQNVPNGVYRVTRVTDDLFMIGQQNILQTAGIGTTPNANAQLTVTAGGANGLAGLTWRRVEGVGTQYAADAGNTTDISNAGANGYETATIDMGVNLATVVDAHARFAAGDIVFIENSSVLLDGFYRVNAVGGGNNLVVDMRYDVGTTDLKTAGVPARGAGAVPNDVGLRVTKVSGNNGGAAFDTFPIRIAHNTSTVTVQKSNADHQYAVGDIIMFTDLATPTITAGTTDVNTFSENTPYVITAVDANSFTFVYDATNAAPVQAAGGFGFAAIGYTHRNDGGGAAIGTPGNINQDAGAILGANAQIQNLTKTFAGRGVIPDLDYFQNPLAATYNGDPASGKDMSSGAVKYDELHAVPVYDAFGKEHTVEVLYKKLTDRVWGVEIRVDRDETGNFPVNGSNQLAFGNITFDGQGQIESVDPSLEKAIGFPWSNGSDASSITFDFGVGSTKTGITMLAGEYDIRFMDPNGNKAGALETIDYLEDGTIIARFTNGSSRAYAKLPVAVVPDPNALISIGAGHFVEALNKSGAIVLKQAGVGGAGIFLPGFLEASKVDENEALLKMTRLNHYTAIAYSATNKKHKLDELAVSML